MQGMKNTLKKICFITASRAEYGLMKWMMKEVDAADEFQLQVIVTGGHLMQEQGHTIDQILKDDVCIDRIVEVYIDTKSQKSIAKSMGRMAEMMSNTLDELCPDFVVVLGDRYELLPICSSAFIMGIPIIHISGGDVTKGVIDDGVRNAVTMLADYHFPGTKESAENIIRMRGTDKNIWVVGEPGLDSFRCEKLMCREELAEVLSINSEKQWVLFTFHPETKENLEYNLSAVKYCIEKLISLPKVQVVATYSNSDYGGSYINEYLEEKSKKSPERIRIVPSLGNRRYLSLMRQVGFMIGNSSSGIVEAPMLGIPVINIGNRQLGRHCCANIIQVDMTKEKIEYAIDIVGSMKNCEQDFYWGDGHTAERIINILKKECV